jgi:hypothetical protein
MYFFYFLSFSHAMLLTRSAYADIIHESSNEQHKGMTMASHYTGHDVFMGKTITCQYDGKQRTGKVIKTMPTFMLIEYMTGTGKMYRSLTFDKCVGISIVVE